MSALRKTLLIAVPVLGLTAVLAGCSYDYLQHTDRIAFNAGDAEKANLEAETTNPDGKNAYNTKGLGANGAAGSDAASAP